MIKELDKEDVSKVAGILVDYWKTRSMEYSIEWTENYIKEGHKKEIIKDKFFTLKENNEVIGVIAVIIYEGNIAELRDFVVSEKYRGQGYGKKIIQEIIEWCKKQDIRKIYALACPEREHIYAKYGFEKEGLLKNHFTKGEDLTFMSRFLK
jgi:N-acetylglutamate synthase-like GNAT family acetyltransferase